MSDPMSELEKRRSEAIREYELDLAADRIADELAKTIDSDAIMQQVKDYPLFMNNLPEGTSENPHLEAIQSLLYAGTPEENAENFKQQGNERYARGEKGFRDAIEFYTKGIDIQCSDATLTSVLYANRAAVHLELKNYRQALDDCKDALRFQPKNVKAHYRATKISLLLGHAKQAAVFLEEGLLVEPKNMALLGIKDRVYDKIEEMKALEKRQLEELNNKQIELEKLQRAILQRKIKMCLVSGDDTDDIENSSESMPINRELMRFMKWIDNPTSHRVYLDENGRLHWPVVFVYPEYGQTDFIQDVCEDDTLMDHMEMMFPYSDDSSASTPAVPWDVENKYKPSSMEVFFETSLSEKSQAGSEIRVVNDFTENVNDKKLVFVDPQCTFKLILSHPHYRVFQGLPTFLMVVKQSPFRQQFVDRYRLA